MDANTESAANVFGDWDGNPAAARSLQAEPAKRVSLHDDFPPSELLAGFDVGFEEEGTITRAAAVLLDAGTLQPLESHIARVATSMPYVFRACSVSANYRRWSPRWRC